ncbi:hypothetical protein [Streptomyces sp. NPDC048057]|uniref:hypothetical protein n=1 Tax=Streptomyces sp. NPDC048057 TaxID=3155628 RepID=UPI0033E12413
MTPTQRADLSEPSDLDAALVEEATKKSGLVWVRGEGADAQERALWHVWHDGAAHVVGDGPQEQPLPGLVAGGRATVTVRSKDKGGRLVSWAASVRELEPRSEEWESAVAELKTKRLNATDTEGLREGWARGCRVLRLELATVVAPLPDDSLAEPPRPTSATTRGPIPPALPKLLRRGRRA